MNPAIAGVDGREHPLPREFTLQGQVPLLDVRSRRFQRLVSYVLTAEGGRPATGPPRLKQGRRPLAELKSLEWAAAGRHKRRVDAEAQRVRGIPGGVPAFEFTINDPVAGAHRRLPVTGQVIGESDARTKVGPRRQSEVAVLGYSRVLQHAGQAGLRIDDEGVEVGA